MKIDSKSLCSDCCNLSVRTIEDFGDSVTYHYKGKGYSREYACLKGHKIYAHQVTTKCSAHRPRKKRVVK